MHVVARLHPLREERLLLDLPAGLSIAEIAERAYVGQRRSRIAHELRATLGGEPIDPRLWHRVRPKPGALIVLQPVPRNMRMFASLLVMAAAIAASVWLAGPGGPLIAAGLAATEAALVGAAAAAAISIAGTFLTNALFPIAQPKLEQSQRQQSFSISGFQNRQALFEPIPWVLGRHRVYPAYAARPFTEQLGNDQFLRALFCVGYGPLAIDDIRLGETPIGQFQDVEIEIFHGYSNDGLPTLYPGQVFQQDPNVNLVFADGWHVRTTANDVDELAVDFVAPSGILAIAENGKRHEHSIGLDVEYSIAGANNWQPWISAYRWAGKTENLQRLGFRRTVSRGQYDVRVRRAWAEWAGNNEGGATLEQGVWTALRGYRNESPIRPGPPLALIAIRIRASDQLSGVIDNLNCIVHSRMRVWNGSVWLDDTVSSNPADIFRHILQGPGNARPVGDDRIDFESLQAWHTYCSLNGFAFNMVRDFRTSIREALQDVCAAGRAALTMVNGRFGVIWDQPDAAVVQMFTPRNAWGFRSRRAYKYWPHAWRVRFKNEQQGWYDDERIVYDDGYDEHSATRFEGIEFPGVTNPDLIWRHGRFHIAQARLRPEPFEFFCDMENLACTRGDRVRFAYDVPRLGIVSGRVTAVSASSPQSITLDETVIQVAGKNYAIRARLADGSQVVRSVTTIEGEGRVIRLTGSGALPAVGDLVAFGEADRETIAVRIKAILPQEDFAARLIVVDDAPEISQADQGPIPPYNSNITIPPDPWQLPPTDLRVREYVYLGQNGAPLEAADLSWQVPRFGVIRAFEVQISDGNQSGPWRTVATVSAPETRADVTDLADGTYWFRVRCLFADGKVSSWTTSGPHVFSLILQRPPDVAGFRISVLGQVATLSWDRVNSVLLSHYRVRFSPELSGVTWGAAQPYLDRIGATSVQVQARRGTYLVKAVGLNGLESENPAGIVTNIALLSDMNVVETVEEDPDFAGAMEDVVYDPLLEGIRLADGQMEGYYYFDHAVDLQDVFTSRLSASLHGFGINLDDDIFAHEDVFALDDVFGVDPSSWTVVLEVRYSNDGLDASPAPQWSDWEEFTASDYTARSFEFRLYLRSTEEGTTPVVKRLAATVDMPDRVEADNDILVSVSGLRVDFEPPFLGFRGVAIAAQDLATGDYAEITNKSASGFDIVFRNSSGTPVERTFDYVAKGYGRRLDA